LTSTFNASTNRACVTKKYKNQGHFWVTDRRLADVSMVGGVITRKADNHKVMRIRANITFSRRVSAWNVCELPKFSRLYRNRGRGTRWWRQILDRKCESGNMAVSSMRSEKYAL